MDKVLPSGTVLIADDHPDTADSLAALLQMAAPRSVHAVAVYDGMQAVLAAKAQSFDAVLLDIEMPALDGIAAGKAIRDMRPRANLIVIAMSGCLTKVQEARESAVFDLVMLKPINVEVLLEKVFLPDPEKASKISS